MTILTILVLIIFFLAIIHPAYLYLSEEYKDEPVKKWLWLIGIVLLFITVALLFERPPFYSDW